MQFRRRHSRSGWISPMRNSTKITNQILWHVPHLANQLLAVNSIGSINFCLNRSRLNRFVPHLTSAGDQPAVTTRPLDSWQTWLVTTPRGLRYGNLIKPRLADQIIDRRTMANHINRRFCVQIFSRVIPAHSHQQQQQSQSSIDPIDSSIDSILIGVVARYWLCGTTQQCL